MTTDLRLIEQAVKECFATDKNLTAFWHVVSGNGLNACVVKTMSDVAKFDPSFKFYMVFAGDDLAGYFGTEFDGKYVNLIFVKPEYRNKRFMTVFWEQLNEHVKDTFYTSVYKKNTPAISFYSKHGSIIEEIIYDGYKAVIFEINKEVGLCH